jgi:hypothetical protein
MTKQIKIKQDSFGNVLWGFLVNRLDTKFIYLHNLYSMISRLKDMQNVGEMMVNWDRLSNK